MRLAGYFPELEDELYGFTTNGFMGDHSPNHADAMMWGISDLFPELCKHSDEKPLVVQPQIRRPSPNSWMRA